jgi:hypothetical protein
MAHPARFRITRMTKPASPQPTWTKPVLIRLGKIGDVSGNNGAVIDGASVNPRAS